MPPPRFEIRPVDEAGNITAKAVRFSHGTLSEKDRKNVVFNCFSSEKRPGVPGRSVIKAQLNKMKYVAKNYGSANRFPTDSCSYSIAVHNKKTGKVRVMPVDLFQLEPWFSNKEEKESVEDRSFREKTDALAKAFGSGKSQKVVNQRLANKMDEEMVNTTTKTVVDSVHTKNQAVEQSNASTISGSIPPHNKNASTPDDVYKLKDLISQPVLESLEKPSQIFSSCTPEDIARWSEQKSYPSFVLTKLESLCEGDEARLLQFQLLICIHYLCVVASFKYHEWRKIAPCPADWPLAVKEHILSLFSVEITAPGRKRERKCTPQHRDLLLSHILILCLKMNDFCIELSPIAAHLKIPVRRLCTHASSIGCTVKKSGKESESYSATLSAPPVFRELQPKAAKNARIF